MKFSERLYQAAKPIWEKNHQHPFVQGIGDGTLDIDELTVGKTGAELSELEEIFLNTSRYEYLFWEMSYNREIWPTDE